MAADTTATGIASAPATPQRVTELEILACTQCGAPLALADSEAVTCASCGASTPVPETYRELYRARLADAAMRGEAERVLRTLARPPSLAIKVIARIVDQPMLVFMMLYGVPLSLFAILFADHCNLLLAPHLGLASPDDVPFAYMIAIAFAVMFVLALVPRVLGIYANRRVADRMRIFAALRAHPPTVSGGPATCRLCGAPLTVAPDALVATCAYCHAENAVKIDLPMVQATTAVVTNLGRTVGEAAAFDRDQRKATRRLLLREFLRYLIRTLLLGSLFAYGAGSGHGGRPSASEIVALVALVGLFIYYLLKGAPAWEKQGTTASPAERRASNDLPGWVGVVGPIVLMILLFKLLPLIERLL